MVTSSRYKILLSWLQYVAAPGSDEPPPKPRRELHYADLDIAKHPPGVAPRPPPKPVPAPKPAPRKGRNEVEPTEYADITFKHQSAV